MKRTTVFALAAALTIASSGAGYAKGKPTTAPSAKPTPTVSTEWLLPKIQTDPIQVKAGSTVPVKFRLAGKDKNDLSAITVILSGVACATGPTGTPTATPSKPGKSKAAALRFVGNTFQYQWKLAKTTPVGCYKFTVDWSGTDLQGATIQVVANS